MKTFYFGEKINCHHHQQRQCVSNHKSTIFSSSSILILIFLFNCLLLTCQARYKLVWNDEFTGNQLNEDKWSPLVDCSGRGNHELQCYTDRLKNIQVINGSLHLSAYPESYNGREFTSGRVHAKGPGWLHGLFEARARLPKGKHLWPAIWMVPNVNIYGSWPKSGEIDIMESRGQVSDSIEGTIHYGYTREIRGKLGSGMLTFPFDFSDDFHVFSFEWTNSSMTWFLDGSPFYTVSTDRYFEPNESSKKAEDVNQSMYTRKGQPFDHPFKWILNVAVGGGYFSNPIYGDFDVQDAKKWEKPFMEVDWVRVFQQVPDKKKIRIKTPTMVNDSPSQSSQSSSADQKNHNSTSDETTSSTFSPQTEKEEEGTSTTFIPIEVTATTVIQTMDNETLESSSSSAPEIEVTNSATPFSVVNLTTSGHEEEEQGTTTSVPSFDILNELESTKSNTSHAITITAVTSTITPPTTIQDTIQEGEENQTMSTMSNMTTLDPQIELVKKEETDQPPPSQNDVKDVRITIGGAGDGTKVVIDDNGNNEPVEYVYYYYEDEVDDEGKRKKLHVDSYDDLEDVPDTEY